MNGPSINAPIWDQARRNCQKRRERGGQLAHGKQIAADDIVRLLETIIEPGDRVCIEGNNQKQADFLAKSLVKTDPALVRDLHLVQSVLALPEHVDLIEQGQVSLIDFSFSGQQAGRLATLVEQGRIKIGAIHTYLELFGRYFVDLTPKVALIAAQMADRDGNLYTGPNTEDTPAIVEATAFKNGIVIAQVNEIVDKLPRVDIPADWVDFFVKAPTPHYIEPLFTRDPAQITEIQILMGMIAIKGLYAEYGITSLNHGIGFDTAAIELLLPTYAAELGLKGKICTTTPVTCSSVPLCKSTWGATAPLPPRGESPVLAERPTWVPTHGGGGMPHLPGCGQGERDAAATTCLAARSWWHR